MAERRPGAIRRRISFDPATWHALDRLAKDRMETIQELADEAFRDLLKKHRRPTTLKEMLRESLRSQPANDHDRQPRSAAFALFKVVTQWVGHGGCRHEGAPLAMLCQVTVGH
jgi:hypothetical protein